MSTADPLGPGSAVVLFGLASAIAWGAGDFGGGWTSRRAPVFGVTAIVQAVGVALAVALALLSGEPVPPPPTILIAAAAGLVGMAGILSLYHGLAVGRMGVVAPVTGVLAATLPVAAGAIVDGVPAPPIVAGIGFALVAVVLVSQAPGVVGTRSGLQFGLLAGLALGAFNVLIGLLPEGAVFGPLAAVKLASVIGIGVVAVTGRRTWRLPGTLLPAAILVGVFDMGGNAFYVLAAQSGRLDVAAVLSSLYPVTTILLAIVLLGERVTRAHAAGIAAAAAAIVLIAGGSTTA